MSNNAVSTMSYQQSIRATIFDEWFMQVKKDLHKRGAFLSPTLITNPLDARTVILRQLETDTSTDPETDPPLFIIHTDIRSQKWQQLQQQPSCVLHFYCSKRKWQMRIAAQAELHSQDDYAQKHWQKLSPASKKIYALQHTPGSSVESPESAFSFASQENAYQQFAVILMRAQKMESLQLSHPNRTDYHIRASWDVSNNTLQYLAP